MVKAYVSEIIFLKLTTSNNLGILFQNTDVYEDKFMVKEK